MNLWRAFQFSCCSSTMQSTWAPLSIRCLHEKLWLRHKFQIYSSNQKNSGSIGIRIRRNTRKGKEVTAKTYNETRVILGIYLLKVTLNIGLYKVTIVLTHFQHGWLIDCFPDCFAISGFFFCYASEDGHPALAATIPFWDNPFSLLGINTSSPKPSNFLLAEGGHSTWPLATVSFLTLCAFLVRMK